MGASLQSLPSFQVLQLVAPANSRPSKIIPAEWGSGLRHVLLSDTSTSCEKSDPTPIPQTPSIIPNPAGKAAAIGLPRAGGAPPGADGPAGAQNSPASPGPCGFWRTSRGRRKAAGALRRWLPWPARRRGHTLAKRGASAPREPRPQLRSGHVGRARGPRVAAPPGPAALPLPGLAGRVSGRPAPPFTGATGRGHCPTWHPSWRGLWQRMPSDTHHQSSCL